VLTQEEVDRQFAEIVRPLQRRPGGRAGAVGYALGRALAWIGAAAFLAALIGIGAAAIRYALGG
jgi:dienelactone hydrolase